jgi:Ca-activated chloride channel family protein
MASLNRAAQTPLEVNEDGFELAYQLAFANMIPEGNNHVLLATDGDFNLGFENDAAFETFIKNKLDSGVALSCFGFDMELHRYRQIERLSKWGSGSFAYINSPEEMSEALCQALIYTTKAFVKDVQLRLDFNPQTVKSYRFLGRDNDTEECQGSAAPTFSLRPAKSYTAFYEIVPRLPNEAIQPHSKYLTVSSTANRDELCEIALSQSRATVLSYTHANQVVDHQKLDLESKFALAVAYFGEFLKSPGLMDKADLERIIQLAEEGLDNDPFGRRNEFISLVKKSRLIIEK